MLMSWEFKDWLRTMQAKSNGRDEESAPREQTLKHYPPKVGTEPVIPLMRKARSEPEAPLHAESIIVDASLLSDAPPVPPRVSIRSTRSRPHFAAGLLGGGLCLLAIIGGGAMWRANASEAETGTLAPGSVALAAATTPTAKVAAPTGPMAPGIEAADEAAQEEVAQDEPAPDEGSEPAVEAPAGATTAAEATVVELEPSPTTQRAQLRKLMRMGKRQLRRGRPGPARQTFREALELKRQYPPALAGMARSYIVSKDPERASHWAWRLVKARPDVGAYQLLLGDARLLGGDVDRARSAYSAAKRMGHPQAGKRLAAMDGTSPDAP